MNEYTKQANDFAKEYNVKLTSTHLGFMKYFPDDKDCRHVFKCKLTRNGKNYTFKFGQSIANKDKNPSLYDVLTCLEKYEPLSFDDFCNDYGYSNDSIQALKAYKAVKKESLAVHRLFGDDDECLYALREIC